MRRGLKRCGEALLDAWLSRHERGSYEPLPGKNALAPLTQLYRDRGDCENNFDECKKQCGWCGFVMQKIKPTHAMARLIAIVANWWNVFCRLASTHAEAPEIRESLERIGAFLGAISTTAPQLGFDRTWALILRVAFRKWLGGRPLDPIFDSGQMLLRLSG